MLTGKAQTAGSWGFSPWDPGFMEMGVYTLIIFAILLLLLFLTRWLGEHKPSRVKQEPYECGMLPAGDARFAYPAPFYLVAIFFLIFDVEGAFIFTWAVAFDRLGWQGWLQISFFIIILMASLLYIWKKGGLEWGRSTRL